jgi:hypothetical protein
VVSASPKTRTDRRAANMPIRLHNLDARPHRFEPRATLSHID